MIQNIKNERWKKVIIDGHESMYSVSNKGRLHNGKRLINNNIKENEYMLCSLRFSGRYYSIRLHRIVAIAFKKNPKNLPQVNHKDGKKHNNESKNLEWCTSKHNIIHSFKMGLCVRPKGEKSHLFDKGRKVMHTVTGKIYPSVATAARELGIPRTTISGEINGYRPNRFHLKGL